MLTASPIFVLGILLSSGPCPINTADSDLGYLVTATSNDFSPNTNPLDALVDLKCKKYSAGLQAQIDELKAKVDRTENKDLPAKRKIKRDTIVTPKKSSPPACSTSASLCTYFYPDHPDSNRKKGSYSPTATNEKLSDPNSQFKGVPTSCKDLRQLGHSFNGLYSVSKSQPTGQGAKIETVFCDFQSPTDSKGFETRIGIVDIKSSAVHFHVQRTEDGYGIDGQKITFLKEVFNVGGGFDWKNQFFRAPYNGTYFFSVSGSKSSSYVNTRADIHVKVNNEFIGEAISSSSTTYGGLSYQFIKKLKTNDTIELFMYAGKSYLLYFTGSMLDEDLII